MTIEEAIQHCEEKSCSNSLCAQDYKQLAEWLTELKHLREWKAQIMSAAFDSQVAEGSPDAPYTGSLPVLNHADMILLPEDKFKVGDMVKLIVLTKEHEEAIEVSTSSETLITDSLLLEYGFEPQKQEGHYYKYVKYDEYREVELHEYSDTIWIFHHHDVEFSTPDTQITVCDLSQLRQALSLCGCLDLLIPNSK